MRRPAGILSVVGVLATAGCVSSSPPSPPPGPAPALESVLEVTADRLRIVVPSAWRERVEGTVGGVAVDRWRFSCRPPEAPRVEFGEDFSFIAEGEVILRTLSGSYATVEGPFQVVLHRNGLDLRR